MGLFPYLAVAAETVDHTMGSIERAGTWTDHVLMIGLFAICMGGAIVLVWFAFKQAAAERKALKEERAGRDADRAEYIENLKTIAANNAVALDRTTGALDRNTTAFGRLDGLKEACLGMVTTVQNLVTIVQKLDLDWRMERATDGQRTVPNRRREEPRHE